MNLTGRDLINWIIMNKAENMPVCVRYRDSSGTYDEGVKLRPNDLELCETEDIIFSNMVEIRPETSKVTSIVL